MLNELFYSYVDDTEKEYMAMEAAFEIDMQKERLALEYADRLYDIKLMESNARVLNESGTYADIDSLYMEAAAENAKRKDNIFVRMFRKIKQAIADLLTKIANLFSSKKIDDFKKNTAAANIKEVPVKKDASKILDAIDKAFKTLGNLAVGAVTKKNDAGERVFSAEKTIRTAVEAAAVVGAAKYIKTELVEPTIKKTQAQLEFTKKTANDWENYYQSMLDSGHADSKDVAKKMADEAVPNKVASLLGFVNSTLTSVMSDMAGVVNKYKDEAKDVVNAAKQAKADKKEEKRIASELGDENAKLAMQSAKNGVTESAMDFMESEEYDQTCSDIEALIDNL